MTRGEVEAVLGPLPPLVGGLGDVVDPWTAPEPDPTTCEVVIHPDGKAEVVDGALGFGGWRRPLVAVDGADGTAWLHVGGGRLKRAGWEPNPGAAPSTGLVGR